MKGKSLEEVGAVVIGASCGALCRWLTVETSYFRNKPYLGILCVNGIGSIILGAMVGYQSLRTVKPHLSLLLGVGFCGALTTFSTYSMDVLKFSQQGEMKKALTYVAVSNIAGIGGVACGYSLMRKIIR